jgi:hypothetical protein
LRAAALTFRLGLAAAFGTFAPRCFAHLVRWAAAILARAALLIFRRFFGAGLAWADTPSIRASFFSNAAILSLI